MEVPFYDCMDLEPTADGWLDIERIYCFNWDGFTSEQYRRLHAVFDSLPGSKGQDPHDCHWWFAGHEDVENGYLTAGIEPPGLQVFGTLRVADWEAWDREFRQKADGLPVRSLRNV